MLPITSFYLRLGPSTGRDAPRVLLEYRPVSDANKSYPPRKPPPGEPAPAVTPLAGTRGAPRWEICTYRPVPEAEPADLPGGLPEGFEETLTATRAEVGREVGQGGVVYDGAITAASDVRVEATGRRVTVGLSPLNYSGHLASRRYGERYGYHKAPYKAAISSVLLKTAEGLWVLAQRSALVDISKGKVGFSAGGFVDPELIATPDADASEADDLFALTALRELEEETGVRRSDLAGPGDAGSLSPNVLITSWRKVEVSYVAHTPLTLDAVRERAAAASAQHEHQRLIGTPPKEYPAVLRRYGTWPGVPEALAYALEHHRRSDPDDLAPY